MPNATQHTPRIIDATERTAVIVCGERAYMVPIDVSAELSRLRAVNAEMVAALAQIAGEPCAHPGFCYHQIARAAIARAKL